MFGKNVRILLAAALTLAMLLPAALCAFAAEYYMAYNFYSNPVLSGTSGKFDTFMIDFRGVKTPKNTYWSLCNFGMDLTSAGTRAEYPNVSGYGAYCGLQNTTSAKGRTGILSFWEANYQAEGSTWQQLSDGTYGYAIDGEKVILRASRVYPSGEGTFGGEGEGTNIIENYPWEDNKWYTCMIHCWTDAETGTTFAGEWFRNNETGEWLLFSYFDTHLYDSYFVGGMSQFQENYSRYSYNYTYERECNLKNMYVFDHNQQSWKSLSKSTLSYGDGGASNKAGAHTFGVGSDEDGQFWWGSTGGAVDDQEAYEAAAVKSGVYTISQPSLPDIGISAQPTVTLNENAGRSVSWTIPATAVPQLGYTVNVYNADGELLFTKHATRPETRSVDISEVTEEAIRCEVLIDNVFGTTQTSAEAHNDAYERALRLLDPEGLTVYLGTTYALADSTAYVDVYVSASYIPAKYRVLRNWQISFEGAAITGERNMYASDNNPYSFASLTKNEVGCTADSGKNVGTAAQVCARGGWLVGSVEFTVPAGLNPGDEIPISIDKITSFALENVNATVVQMRDLVQTVPGKIVIVSGENGVVPAKSVPEGTTESRYVIPAFTDGVLNGKMNKQSKLTGSFGTVVVPACITSVAAASLANAEIDQIVLKSTDMSKATAGLFVEKAKDAIFYYKRANGADTTYANLIDYFENEAQNDPALINALKAYDQPIVNGNVVSFIGGIAANDLEYKGLAFTVDFGEGKVFDTDLREETKVNKVFTTVKGVASANEQTAAAMDIAFTEGFRYIAGLSVTGVPSGTYTVVVTFYGTVEDDHGTDIVVTSDPVEMTVTVA